MAPDAKERVRAAESANGDSPLVLKAVLCSGLFPNVLRALPGKKFPQLTHGKQTVQVHPSSFNRDVNKFETPYLVYHEKVQSSGKIFVHDCSGTTALDLILFGAEPQVLHAQHRVLIDGWIEMRVSPRSAVLFKALRHQLSEYLRARIGANVKLQAADAAGVGGGAAQAAVLDKIHLAHQARHDARARRRRADRPAGRGAAGRGGAGRGGGASRGGRR